MADLLTDPDRYDVRYRLPDPVLQVPEAERGERTWGGGPVTMVRDVGAFVRCLLPVRLTGGATVVYGTWLSVRPDDLKRAYEIWDTPGYAGLRLTGVLANAIDPWGTDLYQGFVTCEVRDPDELPYVTASAHPTLTRILETEWDRDEVLSHIGR